jgi:hypothetical protein
LILYTVFEEKLDYFEQILSTTQNMVMRKVAAGSFRVGAFLLRYGMAYLTEPTLVDVG